MFTFIESSIFTRVLPVYLDDDEYSDLQQFLLQDPEAGEGSWFGWGSEDTLVQAWNREARRASDYLFRPVPTQQVLDADALCKGKARERARAHSEAAVGGISR